MTTLQAHPEIILIAAMAKNRVIGHHNQLPWRIPEDLAHFKRHTLHCPIIMGRKTWESIGRALPERRNIVLSHRLSNLPHAECYDSLETALNTCHNEPKVFIIGGETVFRKSLPLATQIIITYIDAEYKGDTFFPEWSEKEWKIADIQPGQSAVFAHSFQFITLKRVSA